MVSIATIRVEPAASVATRLTVSSPTVNLIFPTWAPSAASRLATRASSRFNVMLPDKAAKLNGSGLECDGARATHTRCENGVASDIRANVRECIFRPQEMQQKWHVLEFVPTARDSAGRARHAAAGRKTRALDPRHDQFVLQPAFHLSADKTAERAQL